MKRLTAKIGVLLLATELSVSACVSHPPAESATVAVDESFTLPIGYTARVRDAGLAVVFSRVLEDSRCPRGVQCVHAGNARVELVLRGHGRADTVALSTNTEPRGVQHGGHVVELLGVEPVPDPEQPTTEYAARLVVSGG